MKSANFQRYQALLEDYRFIRKSVARFGESGIIKMIHLKSRRSFPINTLEGLYSDLFRLRNDFNV